LQATASAISANLVAILDGVHVKNPELITYVSVAVAVINSAITVLISSLPAQQATSARSATIQSHETLPLLRNAKKASDLKAAWNNVVKMEHPEAVVNNFGERQDYMLGAVNLIPAKRLFSDRSFRSGSEDNLQTIYSFAFPFRLK